MAERINPWLLERLKEKEWYPPAESGEILRLIVEVEPDYVESVKAAIQELPNVTIIDQSFNYVRVRAPVELIPRIAEIPHVVEVHYDVPVRVYEQPLWHPFWDPLIGEVRPSRVEFEFPGPDLLAPFPFLPLLPRTLFFGPFRYKFIPLIDSKKHILDVKTELTGEGVKVAVLDTGVEIFHPQLKGRVKALSTCLIEPWPIDGCGHGHWCCTCIRGD